MRLSPRWLSSAVLTPLALLLAAAPQASAATPISVDTLDLLGGRQSLTTATAVRRTCFDAPLAAGAPGVLKRTVTTTIDGYVQARLHGTPHGDDWDLAVFDAVTGRLVDASAAFGGNELVSAPVAAGRTLIVQACRYDGSAAPIDLSVDELVVSGDVPPAERQSLVLVKVAGQADVDRLVASGLDLNETGTKDGVYAVLHGSADRATLSELGIPFTTSIPDLRQADLETLRADATASPQRAALGLPSGRTSYRHLADYQMDLKKLVTDHPGVVRPLILPHKSIEGRTIEGVEIATDVARTDDGRPTVFELGLHHVREWSSGEMTIEGALDLFTARDGADGARKQAVLDGVRSFVIPVVNPDGLVASQLAGDFNAATDDLGTTPNIAAIASGTGSYRRKNCSNGFDNSVPANAPCSLQPGVDLNRNYGAFWGGPGESDNVSQQDYRGPSPFSEPEAQNIHELSSTKQVMVMNSNHNFAGDVLYQPGFNRQDEPGLPKGTKVPYQDAMKAVAKRTAQAAGYVDLVSYDLYDVSGATEDWNYFAQGAFGYTTEVGYDNFHPNYQDAVIDQFLGTLDGKLNKAAAAKAGSTRKVTQGLRESLLLFAEAAVDPAYHSVITGTAPAGRILRLTKDFKTTTSKVQTNTEGVAAEGDAILIPEHLESTLTVPASGTYRWAVNPSTRPLELIAGRTEAWTLTCEDEESKVVYDTRKVTVEIGASSTQNFSCGKAAPPKVITTTPAQTTTTSDPATPAATAGDTTSTPGGPPAGTTTSVSPATLGLTGGSTTASPAVTSFQLLRPAFSARRTAKRGSIGVSVRLTGETLKNLRVSIRDAKGRLLLSGSRASLTRSGSVTLRRRARLRPGPVRVHLSAVGRDGRRVSLTRRTRIVR